MTCRCADCGVGALGDSRCETGGLGAGAAAADDGGRDDVSWAAADCSICGCVASSAVASMGV